MSKQDGGPAFPVQFLKIATPEMIQEHPGKGMSLRDYFAAKAMQAYLSSDPLLESTFQSGGMTDIPKLVRYSYETADEMLKEREIE